MTDPSPDCGYTDVLSAGEETLKDAILDLADLAAGWCSPSARGNPEVINAVVVRAHDAASALAAAVAEQTQRADQAWEEIARLREFGEHYSGAAQDAWDRIEVLEKALREIAYEAAYGEMNAWSRHHQLLRIRDEALNHCGLTIEQQAILVNRGPAALAAGSASPGGAEDG